MVPEQVASTPLWFYALVAVVCAIACWYGYRGWRQEQESLTEEERDKQWVDNQW